ncbi:low-specificity L-threonine aldolase [Clostridium sp. YIM B02505]|uniref:Low-specificity L-threonine aldolase n=1 Tax=Clostridium yunnanense TaxID=2800325 RepID=A0ABS1ENI3_9CLOT|nr:low-specificity L-threonine aldolase [Clostridium yunnanense]MBK1810932.1 low-specificity L-threonine aldolase [Clostridium yunnanense]
MLNKFIDLRSDTVTQPTEAMREAMFKAMVGDDVYGDDPTVNELEKYAAELVGMEAALFVPSGTFGNQLALFTHCRRGEEVILGEDCHIVAHEVGAAAVIAGVQLRALPTERGRMNLDKIRDTIRTEDIHFPETSLICVENAYSNGAVVGLDYIQEISHIAKKNNLKVHLDGARLFNAAAFLKVEAKEITRYCDSVMFCLSKGLCAPVGSILAGNKEFIDKARKKRKLMGGGLRQAGFLAAAGLIALKDMTNRLSEDHENAVYLADELEKIEGIKVDRDNLDINMVFFTMDKVKDISDEIVKHFNNSNIKINGQEGGKLRFVTHYWVSKEDIDYTISTLNSFLNNSGK